MSFMATYMGNIFRFMRPVHNVDNVYKVDLKMATMKIFIFLQSPHQVDVKKVVEC